MPFLAVPVIVIGATTITVGQILGAILAMAISMGLSALTKPSAPKMPGAQLQSTIKDPTKARDLVLGRVRKGGTILFIESIQQETVLLMVVAVAAHEVEAIDEIYFFDDLVVRQSGTIAPKYRDLVQYEKFLGTTNQQASTLLLNNTPKWTSNHRLRGIAYIALRIEFAAWAFSQIPNVTCIVRGAKVYDPRDGQTKFTSNAALNIAHYLNHTIFGLGAAYGTDIDTTRLITAANACDEDVQIKAGKVLNFSGGHDVINLHDVLDQTGSFCIEARLRPDAIDISGQKILDKDSGSAGWSLQIEDDMVRFITRGLSNVTLDTAGGQMAAGTWKHIAAVWDSVAQTKTIFVDGVSAASVGGITGSLAGNAEDLTIGDGCKASIQDVRLWSDKRTSTEINAYKDKSLTGQETGLAGYWALDEKIGGHIDDKAGNNDSHNVFADSATWIDCDDILGTEKRYTCNGVVFSDMMPRQILEDLLTSMVGSVVLSGGSWLLRAGVYDPPTITFDEGDARDPIVVQPRRAKRDLFNSVRGTFAAPENNWEQSDFPIVIVPGFEAQDGDERITQEINLPYTTSSSTAQRIAWLSLLRNREQLSCLLKSKLSGLKVRAGDFCQVSNSRFGWTDKEFEVISWQLVQAEDDDGNIGLGVDQELRETAAAIYDFNPATDEIPLNPSPNTDLPSPFGLMPIVSEFINRTGFGDIKRVRATGLWPGTIFGMIPNPLTGHLNVDDQLLADGDDFLVFDNYVRVPVVAPYYEPPEQDIGFDDTVRTYMTYTIIKGPDQGGGFDFKLLYDFRLEAGEYGDWQRAIKSIVGEGRYFKHRIEFDFSRGAGGYISALEVAIDKTLVLQDFVDLVVPVGGRTVEFPKRYHRVPSLSYGVKSAGARTVSFPAIDEQGFDVLVFDAGSDAGGTISVQAQGV